MDKLAASRRRGRRPDPAHLAITSVENGTAPGPFRWASATAAPGYD